MIIFIFGQFLNCLYVRVYLLNSVVFCFLHFTTIIFQNAVLSFNYCVTNATGFAISGEWEFGDVAMDTYRTVLVVESSKFNSIIDEIQELYS